MEYGKMVEARFLRRVNRFTAFVELNGQEEMVHVKNTGRCKELLTDGAEIYLQHFENTNRKTKYDVIAVKKGDRLINMDSQAPNKVFYEWASSYFDNITLLKPECKYKNSRFDCYIETENKKIFAEVKGVTLENDGVVMFPDAPTERGVKHINELIEAQNEGYGTYIVFVVQMDNVKYLTPNRATHSEFADALLKAQMHGVKILCLDCIVKEDELKIKSQIKYKPS